MQGLEHLGNKKALRTSWNWNYLKKSCKKLHDEFASNEDWYLEAILGANEDKYLFPDVRTAYKRDVRHFLYNCMTEKDIQFNLASALQFVGKKTCHVHVETSISGKLNRKGKRDGKKYSYRPDILVLSKRKREHRKERKEDNIETSAIEIKCLSYPRYAKNLIKKDFQKLRDYISARIKPKVDSGFFVCVDETGEATERLHRILKRKEYRKRPMGFLVITPNWITEKRLYPRHLEEYRRGMERSSFYAFDRALGKLKNEFSFFKNIKIKCENIDSYRKEPYFFLFSKNGEQVGWAHLGIGGLGGKKHPHLYVNLSQPQFHSNKKTSVTWDDKRKAYTESRKEEKIRCYGQFKPKFYDMQNLNLISDKTYNILKRLVNKM